MRPVQRGRGRAPGRSGGRADRRARRLPRRRAGTDRATGRARRRPAALGIERFQEIEEIYGYGALLAGVAAAHRAGALHVVDPETTAHILLGALTSSAVLIARAPDPRATRARVGRALGELLDGLTP